MLPSIQSPKKPKSGVNLFADSSNRPAIIDMAGNVKTIAFQNDLAAYMPLGGGSFSGDITSLGKLSFPPSSQGFEHYNMFADNSNYERAASYWNNNTYIIETQKAGAGSLRNLRINAVETNIHSYGGTVASFSSGRVEFSQIIRFIGTASGNYPFKHLSITPTISQSGTGSYDLLFISPYNQSLGSGTKNLINLGTNNAPNGTGPHTRHFSVDMSGYAYLSGSLNIGTFGSGANKLEVNGDARIIGWLIAGNLSVGNINFTGYMGAESNLWGTDPIGLKNGSNVSIRWGDNTYYHVANFDTGIGRYGAGVVEINNGTKGTHRDLLARQYRLSGLNTAPESATDTGIKGEIRFTATHIYVCIETNTWVGVALSTI